MDIAVVGSGIAGLGAAWALARRHRVTLYEAGSYLGGHANTVEIEDRGHAVAVDTGFIVYNERNYPNLVRLFDTLGVRTEPSDMSFSVSVDRGAFEYRARASGLLAQPSNLARPTFRRMIREIVRFSREAKALVGADIRESTGEWLDRAGYSRSFRDDFLLPMVACIWSSRLEEMLSYPAATMAGFLDNHGLLDLGDRPQWRTVSGGSREYVRLIADSLDDVRLDAPVTSVVRLPGRAVLREADGREVSFDHVVLATHADTSLGILGDDASTEEREVLGAFRYQENLAVLHRDPSHMPVRRRAWSSWNYLAATTEPDRERGVSLTYWMNRLQNLDTERPVFVTLNPVEQPSDTLAAFTYHHPQYDRAAVNGQEAIGFMQGTRRTWFCGSYCGYGFHEDGLRSGLGVAARLGAAAPWSVPETTPGTPIGDLAPAGGPA
ncbi:MAG: NAD(P)/FAD-dependent oxidoreductase [Actinomycetota bacterium]